MIATGRPSGTERALHRDGRAHTVCHRGEEFATPSRASAPSALVRYTAADGDAREVLLLDGAAGSLLVVDRDAVFGNDVRLVAHISADEPQANASIACKVFVRHATAEVIRCRPLVAEDFSALARGEFVEEEDGHEGVHAHAELRDRFGRVYRLDPRANGPSIPELRWRRRPTAARSEPAQTMSVREVIAHLEAYSAVCALTRRALAEGARRDDLSVATLRMEFVRVLRSPIVLNRKLRETVLALSAAQDLSMSEIAIRCGRVKRDRAGNISGETSWLARRLGILPEGGRDAPTPWIHTDVLALIARRGLGLSPREVEPD